MSTIETKTRTIQIPEAPPIPGLTFRNFQGESDYEHIINVFNTCKEVDDIRYTLTVEAIAHNYAHLQRCNLYTDMIFAEVDGKPVGYSRVDWYPEDGGDYVYFALGWIDPAWRRKGIGTAILKHNERRIREIATGHPRQATKWYQNDYESQQVGTAALLKANGYQEVRWGYRMTRPIGDPLPEAPMPPGIEVRPVVEDQVRLVWDALQDAFSESWGFSRGDEEDYQRFLSDPTFDPSLWVVGWAGDEVAGMVLNFVNPEEDQEYGRKRGWTEGICVRKPWRRQGLARSLLVQSILRFREMGYDETALGVDTQNPNQALNLYQGVGYGIEHKGIVVRKAMTLDPN